MTSHVSTPAARKIQTISDFRTLDEQVNRSLNTERMLATVSGGFGVLALLLSLVGLYGVMSFVVTQQTREIGVRLALGATRSSALWLVLGDAMMDRYVWGDAERISQEAPVILLRADRREERLGGASSVATMLRRLARPVRRARLSSACENSGRPARLNPVSALFAPG